MSSVAALDPQWRSVLGAALGATVLAGLVLWPTALDFPASWQKSEAYHYAWLVLPVFIYLLGWHSRDEILAVRPQPDGAGIVVAVLGALGWSTAAVADIAIGRQLALIVIVQGIILSALGRRLYGRLWAIMGLLFLLLPSADLLLYPLRLLTVKAVEGFALMASLPYSADGFSVRVGEHPYLVLDACAGLSHVTLTVFLGYCYALMAFRSSGKIVALTLICALLGVLSNVIRVDLIVWIDSVRGYPMDLAAHGRIQWLALGLVLVILLCTVLRLKPDGAYHRALSVVPRSSPSGRWIPVVAGLAVFAITGLVTLLLNAPPQQRALAEVGLPEKVRGWELAFPPASWSAEPGLRTLTQDYRRQGRVMRVTVVEALQPGLKLQESQLARNDQALWNETSRERVSACAGAKCTGFVHVRSMSDQQSAARHVYYSYVLGEFRTRSSLALRLATAGQRLVGGAEPARLIAYSVDGEALALDELADIQRSVDAALAIGTP